MSELTLNAGQAQAADGIFKFLLDPQQKFANLMGPGGVGKTFLMGHIIDKVIPSYQKTCEVMGIPSIYSSVDMTATTNKAAQVLGLATNRPTRTVHNSFGLVVKDNYKTGKSDTIRGSTFTPKSNTVIFIDEGSMTPRDLHSIIEDSTFQSKVIYVSDDYQLPPVFEDLSCIYKYGYPEFRLTEPMRTNIPALWAICEQLRETIRTGVFKDIQTVPGIIDHVDNNGMRQELIDNFSTFNPNIRIGAYTNKKVLQFNEFIRELRQLPPHFTDGETVINNSAIKLSGKTLSVEEEVTISDIGEVFQYPVDANTTLAVRKANLTSPYETFTNVLISEDHEHLMNLIKYYGRVKNWERYFFLKNTFPDLRMLEASTIHKLQGSSLDTVYVDMADIGTNNKASEVARLLYVAFSRARYRIVLYGNAPDRYGRII